nr:hypothetical protein [Bradyrhizobium sp.]
LFSANPKPGLNAGSDAEGAVPWARARHVTSKGPADIVTMKPILRRLEFPCIIWVAPPNPSLMTLP